MVVLKAMTFHMRAAKRQRTILRDYFMNEGQLACPMASS